MKTEVRIDAGAAILRETLDAIGAVLGAEVGHVRIARAVAGVYYAGAMLEGGAAGACAMPTERRGETMCCPAPAADALAPGRLRGAAVIDLAQQSLAGDGVWRALGIAALNALADLCWQYRPHPEMELRLDMDAFDAAGIRPGERVVLVGAFVPFLRALKQRRQPFIVLERNPALLKPDEMPFFRAAAEADSALSQAQVVLITGTSLVNDTLDGLLAAVNPGARVAIVGPTVGLLPDPYLRRGVDILGGVRIVEPEAFLDVVAEGGGAHDFLGRSARKVALIRRPLAVRAA
jgi:uncharacterized protein (DUF4213/DUF364 family)